MEQTRQEQLYIKENGPAIRSATKHREEWLVQCIEHKWYMSWWPKDAPEPIHVTWDEFRKLERDPSHPFAGFEDLLFLQVNWEWENWHRSQLYHNKATPDQKERLEKERLMARERLRSTMRADVTLMPLMLPDFEMLPEVSRIRCKEIMAKSYPFREDDWELKRRSVHVEMCDTSDM